MFEPLLDNLIHNKFVVLLDIRQPRSLRYLATIRPKKLHTTAFQNTLNLDLLNSIYSNRTQAN